MANSSTHPSTKWSRKAAIISAVGFAAATGFFLPCNDRFFKTTDVRGSKIELLGTQRRTVVRFGTSILSQKLFIDGKGGAYKDKFSGPCYVDSNGSDGLERRYGLELIVAGTSRGHETVEIH